MYKGLGADIGWLKMDSGAMFHELTSTFGPKVDFTGTHRKELFSAVILQEASTTLTVVMSTIQTVNCPTVGW